MDGHIPNPTSLPADNEAGSESRSLDISTRLIPPSNIIANLSSDENHLPQSTDGTSSSIPTLQGANAQPGSILLTQDELNIATVAAPYHAVSRQSGSACRTFLLIFSLLFSGCKIIPRRKEAPTFTSPDLLDQQNKDPTRISKRQLGNRRRDHLFWIERDCRFGARRMFNHLSIPSRSR